MEEQLITFDTAKLAKEKGFDDRNSSQYIQYDYGENGWKEKSYQEYDDLDSNIGIGDNIRISRPTQSLLQKWLREKHYIETNIIRLALSYMFFVFNDYKRPSSQKGFKTYEEALEVGLQEALKLIK